MVAFVSAFAQAAMIRKVTSTPLYSCTHTCTHMHTPSSNDKVADEAHEVHLMDALAQFFLSAVNFLQFRPADDAQVTMQRSTST